MATPETFRREFEDAWNHFKEVPDIHEESFRAGFNSAYQRQNQKIINRISLLLADERSKAVPQSQRHVERHFGRIEAFRQILDLVKSEPVPVRILYSCSTCGSFILLHNGEETCPITFEDYHTKIYSFTCKQCMRKARETSHYLDLIKHWDSACEGIIDTVDETAKKLAAQDMKSGYIIREDTGLIVCFCGKYCHSYGSLDQGLCCHCRGSSEQCHICMRNPANGE